MGQVHRTAHHGRRPDSWVGCWISCPVPCSLHGGRFGFTTAGVYGDIGVLFILGLVGFFAFLYPSGRAIGAAGIKHGGDRWRSGTNEVDRRDRVPPRADNAPSKPAPPSTSPGWYRDLWRVGKRYWDGDSWIQSTGP